jgi:hypothetical protein
MYVCPTCRSTAAAAFSAAVFAGSAASSAASAAAAAAAAAALGPSALPPALAAAACASIAAAAAFLPSPLRWLRFSASARGSCDGAHEADGCGASVCDALRRYSAVSTASWWSSCSHVAV